LGCEAKQALASAASGARLDAAAGIGCSAQMDLNGLLIHYFATGDLAAVSPGALERGGETLSIDFGKEQELGRKFALWVLMDAIGIAPLPADEFPTHPELKRAANNWLAASERLRDG
jgi:hypothetical protein